MITPKNSIPINPVNLELLEQRLRDGSAEAQELEQLKETAILQFRQYFHDQDTNKTKEPSAFYNLGDGWQAAVQVDTDERPYDDTLILKNDQLGIDIAIPFREDSTDTLNGLFKTYICDKNCTKEAVSCLDFAIGEVIRKEITRIKESSREKIRELS